MFAIGTVLSGPVSVAQMPCQYEITAIAAPSCRGLSSPTRGTGINEAGQIVGYYTTCAIGADEAFRWDPRTGLVTLPRPAGVDMAYGSEINDGGLIVGTMVVSGMGFRAYLHDGSRFIDLGVLPGAIHSFGRGINNQGDVVGRSEGNGLHAFLYRDGVMIDLMPDLGTPAGEALDVNDAGQVVGWMGTAFSDAHAYIWEDGIVTDLGVIPGGFTSEAHGINGSGCVVGSGRVDDGGFSRAFLWNGTEMLNLGPLPGFERTSASDVNEVGQIVGRAWGVSGNPNVQAAFIWQNGVMTDLNDLISPTAGVEITWATALNNQGQITGQGHNASGDVVAVLLTPVVVPGDLDGDCTVGVLDLLSVLGEWGPCEQPCPPACTADADGDCNVGVLDLLAVLANWS